MDATESKIDRLCELREQLVYVKGEIIKIKVLLSNMDGLAVRNNCGFIALEDSERGRLQATLESILNDRIIEAEEQKRELLNAIKSMLV